MNYYAARQRKLADGSGGAWDYTKRNDNRIWPVGYCAGRNVSQYGEHEQADEVRAKYHDDGHASKDEACSCYRQYLLDQRLRLDGKYSGAQYKCEADGCEAWTQRFAEVDMVVITLCDEHCTREEVEKHFPSVGETFSSW